MSEISFEGKEPFQEFLQWKEKTWRQGSGGPSGYPVSNNAPDPRYQYVSWSQLREEFTKPRIQKLLDAVFAGSEKDAPDADTILEDYLRPFIILVLLGHGLGRLILHFLKHPALGDKRLPFQKLPYGFPKSVNEPDLFANFCKLQWQFCPVELKYNMRQALCSDHILPLQYKKTLAGGGSAVTYKIKVDAEYNKLEHPNRRSWDTLEENRNIYVIKSYQTDEAQEYYDNECSGFRKLNMTTVSKDIIGFYGNFTWDNSYNVILEYADRGTLESYMRTTDRPSLVKEYGQIWRNYLCIVNGLATIHGKRGTQGKKELMLGWHQDFNPQNILVKSGKTTSQYDCQFKIADLGLSHFERSVDEQSPTAKDSHGTFTYGPPETCRPDPDVQSWDLEVRQSIDIWAFACMTSEFAVWVALGYNKVEEYRYQRGLEFFTRTGESGQCFHDRERVLDAVVEVHKEICHNGGKKDNLTPTVTKDIAEEVMLVDIVARPNANQLYAKYCRILNGCSLEKSLTTEIEASPSGLRVPLSPAHRMANEFPRGLPRLPEHLHYDAPRNPDENFGALSGVDQECVDCCQQTLSPRSTSYNSDDRSRREDAEAQGNRRSHQSYQVLEVPPQAFRRFSDTSDQVQVNSSPNGIAELPGNSPQGPKFPPLTLHDAREIMRQNEKRAYSSYGRLAPLVRMLQDRAQVFVIDISKPMSRYRSLMSDWLQLIGYIVQNANSDSEVYFTGSCKKSKAKTYHDLLTLLEQKSFENISLPNVAQILTKIFEDYQNQLGRKPICFRRLFRTNSTSRPRKLSIWVLTPGDWGYQNDLRIQTATLVDTLRDHKMENKQVGVQLLRFGHVIDGIKNLQELDRELGLRLDIFDTGPAEGGEVCKVMLGPVDENYDDDQTP